MAKKPVRRKYSAASSSKTSKVSAKKIVSKSASKNVSKGKVSYKPKSVRAKSSSKPKKRSYKEEYIKLLEKTNKTLTKEVTAIRKAIEQPKEFPPDFEAFPKEETPATPPSAQARTTRDRTTPQTIEEEILGKLTDIEMEIRSKDQLLDDLAHGSPKLTAGGGFDGN